MSWSDIARDWAGVFIDVAAPVLFGLLLAWLRQHHINTTLLNALGRAAGLAYIELAASGARVTDKQSLADAVKRGADYMAKRVPEFLEERKIGDDELLDMVKGELGRHLGPAEAAAAPIAAVVGAAAKAADAGMPPKAALPTAAAALAGDHP